MIALTFLVALQVGQWTTIPPLNVPRQEVGVAAVEGRVYVIGGIGTDQQGSKVVEIFDTQAGRWRLGPSFPIPIHHPSVAEVGSKIYVAGGYSDPGFTPVAKVFELDTDTELWTRKADLRRARAAGAAVEYAGRKNAVALLNSRGEEVTRVSRQLSGNEQLSRFIDEFYPDIRNGEFSGTVTVRSTVLVAVVALQIDRSGITTIPVTPID